MKAIFIAYNQAYNEEIIELLEFHGQRGFTQWSEIQGRGTETGLPHYGNHAWPTMNHSILTIVEDQIVDEILQALKKKDEQYQDLGLRAFSWNVEKTI